MVISSKARNLSCISENIRCRFVVLSAPACALHADRCGHAQAGKMTHLLNPTFYIFIIVDHPLFFWTPSPFSLSVPSASIKGNLPGHICFPDFTTQYCLRYCQVNCNCGIATYVVKKGCPICLLLALLRLLCRVLKFAKAYIEYPDNIYLSFRKIVLDFFENFLSPIITNSYKWWLCQYFYLWT